MQPLTPAEITALYQQAVTLQAQRQPARARELYSRILAARPTVPEVHFQLARMDLAEGHAAAALAHLESALAAKPAEPALWMQAGQTLAALGDTTARDDWLERARAAPLDAQTRAAFHKALGGTPDQTDADVRDLLVDARFAEAETRLRRHLKANPGDGPAHAQLALALAGQGRIEKALKSGKTALRLAPNAAPVHAAMADLLAQHGPRKPALDHARSALRLQPSLPAAWIALARVLRRGQDHPGALRAIDKALHLAPDNREALTLRADLLLREKDFAAAEALLADLIERTAPSLELLLQLAAAQEGRNRTEAALRTYERAIALYPDAAAPHDRRADCLQVRGDFGAAAADFRRALALAPRDGALYRRFAAGLKLSPDDALVATMQALHDDPATPRLDRAQLGFALAKVMEDAGQFDHVFGYLHRANRDMRKLFPYDIAARRAEVAAQQAAFRALDPDAPLLSGTSAFAPVFVTGLPRSGTTLIEQIIAAHSRMTGIGEAGFATREAHRLMARPDGAGLRPIEEVPAADIVAFGHRYERLARALAPNSPQLVDKSIQTYGFLPLIRRALPNARIIVVRRDPRDTLLSIYKNVFPAGLHGYAYDLKDLAEFYTLFDGMIGFWRDLVPDWFTEMHYEDLIADPDAASRRLIAAAGLAWEDACLSYRDNAQTVRTLSLFQVRQPIYKSSLKAWQRYEDELQPMLKALERKGQ
ncbi:sulfotransferase [Brevirhabdus sp.]|uniref:sulfotransferase n=1 Tax=Brevirhabdus sp. TaxID=2004514 RepID=UPI004058BF3F